MPYYADIKRNFTFMRPLYIKWVDNLNMEISKERSTEKRKKLLELQQKTVKRMRMGKDYEVVWSQGRWIITHKFLKAGDKVRIHY